jgi:regulation of enolase protein 1 (concanavalin A-like superfamily)
LGFSSAAAAQTLPAGWTGTDIGQPLIHGSAQHVGDTLDVTGAGGGIGGSPEGFHFVYLPISGDVDVSVFVKSFDATDPLAQAGLMIRESLSPDADYAYVFASGGQQANFLMRARDGLKLYRVPSSEPGMWIRLLRRGNTFRAYNSSDGSQWTLFSMASDYMPATVYLGLAVSSHDEGQTATASFVSSAFVAAPPTLPAPWTAADVGSPLVTGTSDSANGTFTIKGSGLVGDTADQFHYLYQPFTGDMEIIASVDSLLAVQDWSKAGVMIRETLSADAAHASVFATGANGWAFQRRPSAGASAYSTPTGSGSAPGWVRLVRKGDVFTASLSADAATWQVLDTETITMPQTVYVGLAVASHDPNAVATATFSSVAVRALEANQSPRVMISSPVDGATFHAPAQVAIDVTADDPDGSIARVDFYVGSSLIGSVSEGPFSITWNAEAAASAILTAIATDDRGATASSAPVTIRFAAGTEAVPLTRLAFEVPADYASTVSSLTIELRRATESTAAAPSAILPIGAPATVNGEITVDITDLIIPLPLGSYYAVVVARGPAGSAASSPSPSFSR